ncbi:hypothetical protein [Qipengyuania sediminis]|uniref:hypothetical protein n=1 Tax=Qipengyuania sediminis TaxID=1532023 RepID=UPI00105976EC|nr:hypothetical protein [Qipengyuania sediminis]
MDYPNHLARIWLLAGGAEVPPLATMYEVVWSQAATNVGVDWVASFLTRLLSLPVVDRLLRLCMFLGPPLGAVYLGRQIFGRISPWHIASLSLVWTTTAVAGFISYSISLAAALFCAAYVMGRQEKLSAPGLLIHAVFCALLLLIHPFGLLFYMALLAGIVIGPDLAELAPRRLLKSVLPVAAFGLIGAVPVAALMLIAPSPPTLNGITWVDPSLYLRPAWLLKMYLSPILSYDIGADLLFVLPVIAVVGVNLFLRRIDYHAGLLFAASLLLIVSTFAPHSIGDASWIHRRLPLMAALILVAAILPRPRTRAGRNLMVLALTAAVIGKTVWVGLAWYRLDSDADDLMWVTRTVERGSSILYVAQEPIAPSRAPVGSYMVGAAGWDFISTRTHFAAMLVPYRQVFVPTLFAVPGQHPIRVRPDWRLKSMVSAHIVSPSVLNTRNTGYLIDWQCKFDYVLLVDADKTARKPVVIKGVSLVNQRGFAALYDVDRPSRCSIAGQERTNRS